MDHDVLLVVVPPVEVEVLPHQAEQRLVLALPLLQLALLVAGQGQDFGEVLDLGGPEAHVEEGAEDPGARRPAEQLLGVLGVAAGHREGGDAHRPHTLVVVLVVDEEGSAVCGRREKTAAQSLSGLLHFLRNPSLGHWRLDISRMFGFGLLNNY